ncbi:MAG TPA: matrixin family metalloprotease [Vicinamibacterales bacterium]|nr:matrixin family metalloprotease [Vicinamibacterales bacterium]
MKLAAALLALFLAAQAPSAPRHWAKGAAIRVWIDPDAMPANGDALVEKAMKTWTTAADGRFTLVKAWESTAPVRLHFMAADYRYGVTAPRVNRETGLLVKAEVYVAADAGRDPLERQIIVYLTALHELGHALGLDHTNDITSIMYLFREPDDGNKFFGAYRRRLKSADDIGSATATGLSADDVVTLRALYDDRDRRP